MANQAIRQELKQADVKWWQVADQMGIRPTELSVMLRHELNEERTETVRAAIRAVASGKEA